MKDSGKSEILIGRNPVKEALRAGRDIDYVLIQENAGGAAGTVRALAKDLGVKVRSATKAELDRLAEGGNHQGVMAVAAGFVYASLDAILEQSAAAGEDPFVIVLDGIEDPHNLGAIIRTAECAGACGVIIPNRRAAQVNQTAAKSAAGATEFLPVARVSNISRTLDYLKERGLWIYALDMDGENYAEADMKGGVALVIGNEGKGISRLVKEKCDFTLSIPMKGKISSLNASNAAAILMYHVRSMRDGFRNNG